MSSNFSRGNTNEEERHKKTKMEVVIKDLKSLI